METIDTCSISGIQDEMERVFSISLIPGITVAEVKNYIAVIDSAQTHENRMK